MKLRSLASRIAFIALVLILVSAVPSIVSGQESSTAEQTVSECVTCHTNQRIMEGLSSSAPQSAPEEGTDCWAAELPQQEAWKKILVSDANFVSSMHNLDGCISCHGGKEGALDRHIAHQGLIPDPTVDPEATCGECHSTEVELATTGLHQNLTGFRTVLEARGANFDDPAMQEAFDQNCATCHASCGQCHISRPDVSGGGLISGHQIQEFPAPDENCAACHGARVASEFAGSNAGVQGSVHGLQEGMTCYDCHNITEFHGSGTKRVHRYDGEGMPSCVSCHPTANPCETEENLAHDIHWEQVACTVCHVSGPYENCYGCHVGLDEKGTPSATLEESQMQFKIGRNPNPDEVHPWDYVLVRHVPVEPDTFIEYGDVLLGEFDNAPTWKMTTPHNIQRVTLQNTTCNNCHGHEELFLSFDDIRPAEQQANDDVVVEQIPPRTELYRSEEEEEEPVSDCVGDTSSATHVVPEVCQPDLCLQCHPGTHEGDWSLANKNVHTLYALVEPQGSIIVCQDCHSPQGNFDWAAEGYSDERAAELVWNEFPEIASMEHKASSPFWMLGLGLVIVLAAGTPMMLRQKDKE